MIERNELQLCHNVAREWRAFRSDLVCIQLALTRPRNMQLYCGDVCTTKRFVLQKNLYCKSVCTTKRFVLQKCLYYKRICTAKVFVLQKCLYCRSVCTAEVFVLQKCLYCRSVCTGKQERMTAIEVITSSDDESYSYSIVYQKMFCGRCKWVCMGLCWLLLWQVVGVD